MFDFIETLRKYILRVLANETFDSETIRLLRCIMYEYLFIFLSFLTRILVIIFKDLEPSVPGLYGVLGCLLKQNV